MKRPKRNTKDFTQFILFPDSISKVEKVVSSNEKKSLLISDEKNMNEPTESSFVGLDTNKIYL